MMTSMHIIFGLLATGVVGMLYLSIRQSGRKEERAKQNELHIQEVKDVNKEIETHRTDSIDDIRSGMQPYTRED